MTTLDAMAALSAGDAVQAMCDGDITALAYADAGGTRS